MDIPLNNKQLRLLLGILGFALSTCALMLAALSGDPIGPLFRHILTPLVCLVLIIWFSLAWLVRWFVVGGKSREHISDRVAALWGGFRLVLLFAIALLVLGLCFALLLDLDLKTSFAQALATLLIFSFATAVVGSAVANSISAAKHWADRRA